jgi:anti-anti-sigma factor
MKLPGVADDRRVRREHVLAIAVEANGDGRRIALDGELDLSNRDAVTEEIRRAEVEPGALIIDLSELRFIDSCGIACLVEAAERSRADGGKLEIIQGPGPVPRLFQIAGLTELLPLREPPSTSVDGRAG